MFLFLCGFGLWALEDGLGCVRSICWAGLDIGPGFVRSVCWAVFYEAPNYNF